VDVERSEVRGEARLGFRRDRLVAEEQHLVLDQQLPQTTDVSRGELPGQIQAADLCAQGAADWCDLNGHELQIIREADARTN
jgi:hypothetical protein